MTHLRSTAPALVALLVAGGSQAAAQSPISPALLAQARAALPQLPPDMDLLVKTAGVDAKGVERARLEQTYKGVPIWGAGAVLSISKEGSPVASQQHLVMQSPGLDVTPGVPGARATALALRHLAPQAPLLREPESRLVLYPAVKAPSIKFLSRVVDGKVVRTPDAEHSAFGRSVDQGDWALAYHVHTEVADRKEGPRFTDYIVDARSGEILDIWDSMRRHAAPDGHRAFAADPLTWVNAKGVGHSQYSGDVSMDVVDDTANSGQFILQDRLRGFSQDFSLFGTQNPSTGDYGLTVYNMLGSGYTWPGGQRIKFNSPASAWGDGQVWNGDYTDYTTVNSQTVAVDALHGMETYWDMVNNVFGQRGLDYANMGVAARVHIQSWFTFWNPSVWGVDIGDSADTIWPTGESFTQSIAQPEIIAHEMTHGVVASWAALDGRGETASVEESYADVFASLMKFYAGGAGAKGSVIPDDDGGHGDGWTFGLQVLGADPFYPVRSLPFPQVDGISPAAWYHGLANLDSHYGSGVGNRAFYFLAQGAAPYAGPNDANVSSVYVPQGFSGIGNQKAAQLWWDTLTQQISPDADYHVFRLAMTYAAYNRFGPGSTEYAAVENAFAAVNVGAAHGQAPRPLVTMESDSFINNAAALFLVGVPSKPYTAHVANATDTSVTWTSPLGGIITQDGTFTAPSLGGYIIPTVATSNADPLEFAIGYGLVVNGDMDDDTEFDAVDAAEMASQLAGFNGTANHNGSANLWPSDGLNDIDVKVFREAFYQVFTK